MKNNKKGFTGDFHLVMVLLFVMAILIVVLGYVYNTYNTSWQALDIGTDAKNIVGNFNTKYSAIWDWVFIMWVVGFVIVLVMIGIILRSHPVFAVLAMVLTTIFGGIVGVHLSNAYHNFASDSAMISYASNFSKITFIMRHLPKIIVVLSIIFVVVVYSKSRSEGIPGI